MWCRHEYVRMYFIFQLVTESQNTGPHIVSLGKNVRGGFSVRVFTEERRGLSAILQAYTPVNPTTTPHPHPSTHPTNQPYPPTARNIL